MRNGKTILSTAIKAVKYVRNGHYRFLINAGQGLYDRWDDEKYIKRLYRASTGMTLDLNSPKRFNEKLQWLKLHDRNPLYTKMVDKCEAKRVVERLIGDEYVIPTIGVWESFDMIPFEKLPEQFVLKTTHGCGGMYICRDGNVDRDKARATLERTLKKNYFYHTREWPYKNVPPRILAEQYMQDGTERNLRVYKVFNFNGTPRLIQTIQNDKTADETIDYFDTEWNRLDMRQNYPNSSVPPQKPKTLELMLQLSTKCSIGIPFLRTDWYEVNGHVYFSEFTFFSDAGLEPFHPDEWDYRLGEWIHL